MIIFKVIVSKLRTYLEDIILPYQGTFAPNKQVSDNIIITQDILHVMKLKRESLRLMMLKMILRKFMISSIEVLFIKCLNFINSLQFIIIFILFNGGKI